METGSKQRVERAQSDLICQTLVHCLDLIQKAIMCQADTTLLTMRWVDSGHVPSANYSTPRACVDWSRIEDWTRENWVDVKADGMMVHPKYGMFNLDLRDNR